MEKNNHNNQDASKHHGAHRDDMKKSDVQTKKPKTNEPTQKPTTPHTK